MTSSGAWVRLRDSRWTGVLISALLLSAFARGGAFWPVGFLALVPWLRSLDPQRSWKASLLDGLVMTLAYCVAVFAWFGSSVGAYAGLGEAGGLVLLLIAAPLFQPQILIFVLVRQAATRAGASWPLRACVAAAAWVATEALLPRLLDDSLGIGLYPSRWLRQAAEVGGVAGLTVLLLLANEAVAAALARRHQGWREMRLPLAIAASVPLLLAGYGIVMRSVDTTAQAPSLRVGLVQANIVDYEKLKREKGAGAVVREVLDTHYAMSYDAVERQGADAVMWSETVYPTTFGHPKSQAGAELDQEILGIVQAAGVPFVFGTYDSDEAGEYNAAAFVAPEQGLLGFYRKARLFPLTEFVPDWLDGPLLREWLPGAGTWRPGSGAKVFPLRLRDGREVPVLPLICRDDLDAGLAIDGARLGAQAILTLSNDAWFTAHPQGASLHLAAAAFRSIETRLPQFRVTTNGFSAVIDVTGQVVASSRMAERTLVIASLPVGEPRRTLMVAWGDWVGQAAAWFLAVMLVMAVVRSRGEARAPALAPVEPAALTGRLVLLPTAVRMATAALRLFSRGSLLWMMVAIGWGDGALQSNTLAQIRSFVALFLVPEAAAWCLMRAYTVRFAFAGAQLQLIHGRQTMTLALPDIAGIELWRWLLPGPGIDLRLQSGERWRYGLALVDPLAFARALHGVAGIEMRSSSGPVSRYLVARSAVRNRRLDQPWIKFVLLPLALALPAFHLHQHIAYGSALGEYYSYGLAAYLTTFALWWAAWLIAVVLCASALRAAIEAGTLVAIGWWPAQASTTRSWLEHLGLAALYLGLPGWLLLRMLAS